MSALQPPPQIGRPSLAPRPRPAGRTDGAGAPPAPLAPPYRPSFLLVLLRALGAWES